jgi:integrase
LRANERPAATVGLRTIVILEDAAEAAITKEEDAYSYHRRSSSIAGLHRHFHSRRTAACGIGVDRICCHTFRATGITAYLENGGTIENAQRIAAHESPRTSKLYDRTKDVLMLDEIERITI